MNGVSNNINPNRGAEVRGDQSRRSQGQGGNFEIPNKFGNESAGLGSERRNQAPAGQPRTQGPGGEPRSANRPEIPAEAQALRQEMFQAMMALAQSQGIDSKEEATPEQRQAIRDAIRAQYADQIAEIKADMQAGRSSGGNARGDLSRSGGQLSLIG